MLPEASREFQRDLASLPVGHVVDGVGHGRRHEARQSPVLDDTERDGDDGVVIGTGLEVRFGVVVAPLQAYLLGLLVPAHALDLAAHGGVVVHQRVEGCRDPAQSTIDCGPGRGGEIETFIPRIPERTIERSIRDDIGVVEVSLEVVDHIGKFGPLVAWKAIETIFCRIVRQLPPVTLSMINRSGLMNTYRGIPYELRTCLLPSQHRTRQRL